jgi:hypothetical protein
VVEHHVANVAVEGSTPFIRSFFMDTGCRNHFAGNRLLNKKRGQSITETNLCHSALSHVTKGNCLSSKRLTMVSIGRRSKK